MSQTRKGVCLCVIDSTEGGWFWGDCDCKDKELVLQLHGACSWYIIWNGPGFGVQKNIKLKGNHTVILNFSWKNY